MSDYSRTVVAVFGRQVVQRQVAQVLDKQVVAALVVRCLEQLVHLSFLRKKDIRPPPTCRDYI